MIVPARGRRLHASGPSSCSRRTLLEGRDMTDVLAIASIFAGWFLVQRWLLPKMGLG